MENYLFDLLFETRDLSSLWNLLEHTFLDILGVTRSNFGQFIVQFGLSFSLLFSLFSDVGNILLNLLERLQFVLKFLQVLKEVTDIILFLFFNLNELDSIFKKGPS